MIRGLDFFRVKKPLTAAAVILLLVFFHFMGFLRPVENFFWRLSLPALKVLYSSSSFLTQATAWRPQGVDLELRNEYLEQRYRDILTENNLLKGQLAQLTSLQSQIQFLNSKKIISTLASVVSQETIDDVTLLTLDKGVRDGIRAGYPVVVEKGIIIGKIVASEEYVSRLMLLTSSNSQIAATFNETQETLGIVAGDHGLGMKMELIPKETIVSDGTIIITSGLDELVPRGLIIGEVSKIEKDDNGFFQTAFVRPLIPYGSINFVSVIIPRYAQ